MSYVADHRAWQQRVFQEYKAQVSMHDTLHAFAQDERLSQYPDLIS